MHPQKKLFLLVGWAPVILYFVFRIYYFDSWLPNTYYAKVGAPIFERLQSGITYTSPILFCLLGILLTLRSSGLLLRSLFIGCTTQVIIVTLGGGDWMTWGRMLIPMLPFVLVMISLQLSRGHWFLIVLAYFLFPYCTPLKAWPALLKWEQLPIGGFQEGGLYVASQEAARDIRKNLPAGSTIAINHAGFLPFLLSEYRFVDMTGLNDKYIARNSMGGLHQKFDADYVMNREPDLVVLNSLSRPGEQNLSLNYWIGETALYEHPQFLKHYERVPFFYERERFGGGKAYILLFTRDRKTD